MERTEEALRKRVRETPLSERLTTCEKYIASMCAERRPPKMTIPLQHYDEDFYIYTTLADAQATIAALQAVIDDHNRLVREMDVRLNGEQGAAKQASLCDIVSQVQQIQAQLTQRTAELEAAKAELNTVRRDAGLDCGDHSCLYAMNKTGMRTNGGCRCSPKRMKNDLERSRKAYDDLQAELERVRGELAEAHAQLKEYY